MYYGQVKCRIIAVAIMFLYINIFMLCRRYVYELKTKIHWNPFKNDVLTWNLCKNVFSLVRFYFIKKSECSEILLNFQKLLRACMKRRNPLANWRSAEVTLASGASDEQEGAQTSLHIKRLFAGSIPPGTSSIYDLSCPPVLTQSK